jgi:hypothetical protein
LPNKWLQATWPRLQERTPKCEYIIPAKIVDEVIKKTILGSNIMKKKNPIVAVFLNLIIPGLGCAYLEKWKYAILFFFWTPLRLIFGLMLFNSLYSFIFPKTASFIGTIIFILILYIWWCIVMWDTITTPYNLALEINIIQ